MLVYKGRVYVGDSWSSQHKEAIRMFFQKLDGIELDNPDVFDSTSGTFTCDSSARIIIIDMALYGMLHVSWDV